ncbi:hypothetical protein KAK07_18555 [Ideonella sp. 4Y16]|uniref:hypothetical protein n=1 Tax=Ideonella alba TaxID=2824118 RepID=UPI001B3853F4|nr:hypothetical protein [Ideonella alba]MBQ0945346.1 hypothetical protein [Ideonella alba]
MATDHQRILILCKTYPSPSARYVETSCVAGMSENGHLVRLFPVPFRLVEDEQQFRKWQWISARVRRAQDDARPESHRMSVDTIELDGEPLPTRDHWIARRDAIKAAPVFASFTDLEAARESRGVTLGLVRPARLLGLDIRTVENPNWTDDEKAKLMQEQQQGSLFDAVEDQRSLKTLKKLPFDFHYRYVCETASGMSEHRHKLVDWEAGALYWNVHRRPDWQAAFRQKFVTEFSEKDVLFLMGTIHRFPKQWLIVSVLYPPRLPDALARQQPLF